FSTLGPVLLFNIGNRKIGGTTSSILSMLEPITAIIFRGGSIGGTDALDFCYRCPDDSHFSTSNLKCKVEKCKFGLACQRSAR
ncbi:MAG: hypothetical protein PHX79_07855, partial [Sphaerochaetaceae bacterium]|nr:hypothetical protein [Sphaerochaetaceae bacterium]